MAQVNSLFLGMVRLSNILRLGSTRSLDYGIRTAVIHRQMPPLPSSTAGYSTSPIRKPHPSIRAAPYGVAKLYACWISENYHEVYGIYACDGILFNHESPHRSETFVTRKITRGFSRIDAHLYYFPYMGNLDSLRNWGHARADTGQVMVRIDPRYFRPAELATLPRYSKKYYAKLGWMPITTLEELIRDMVVCDREEAKKEALLRLKGFDVVGSSMKIRPPIRRPLPQPCPAAEVGHDHPFQYSPDDRFLKAGHCGMAGSAIGPTLQAGTYHNILTATRSDLDLEDASAVTAWFQIRKPDVVPMNQLDVSRITP
jgi:hypothetical protein